MPIFINPRKCIHAKIFTFTVGLKGVNKANLHHWYLFNKGTHTGKVSFGSFHIQNYQFITMTGGAYILYTNTHYKKNQYLPWSTKWFILVRTLWAYGLYVLLHIRFSLGLGS